MRHDDERLAPGETVHLLREVRGDRRIHEIGTRAHVLTDHGAVIVLHLDGAEAEIVTCPREHVAASRLRLLPDRPHRISPVSRRPAAA